MRNNRVQLLYTAAILSFVMNIVSNGALAQERSMGDGQTGDLQKLVAWSNQATKFAQQSAQWKKEWNPESVGRKDASEVKTKGVIYCLSPAASGGGRKILKEGNATSLAYEDYLKSHPDDGAVRAAYENHERNLQAFHKHWKETDESARCGGS